MACNVFFAKNGSYSFHYIWESACKTFNTLVLYKLETGQSPNNNIALNTVIHPFFHSEGETSTDLWEFLEG